jgi:hypothetical protein
MRMGDIYSYRMLVGKCQLGVGLDWDEIEQLDTLESGLAQRSGAREHRRFVRRKTLVTAVLQCNGFEDRVFVIELSAGGLVVRGAPQVPWGELVELTVDQYLYQYRFRARGVWCRPDDGDYRLGLAFVGIPLCVVRTRGPTTKFDRLDTAA